jgi:DNA mismatch endonuclease (patch repair protein)
MSVQRRRDTKPEIAIRRLLHAQGLRYRVAWPIPSWRRRSIDIAFTRAKVAVFIDGCFWHGCPMQHKGKPSANSEWWAAKLARNQARDRETNHHLEEAGWSVLRIWEHDDPAEAMLRIVSCVQGKTSGACPDAEDVQ